MHKFRIIGRIDINNENVVKGKCLEGLRKIGDPAEFAYKYYLDGVDELVFIDAVASLYDRNSLINILRETCKKVFIPITIGGGIRSLDDIQQALNAGADKVAINSEGLRDISFIKDAVSNYGSQAIVGSVVARRHRYSWEAFMDNAKHRSGIDAIEWAKTLQEAGVGEIMVTSIDCDGLMKGFDTELVQNITQNVNIPVTASGGAGSSQDISLLRQDTSCDAAAVSSLLHYNHMKIRDIKEHLFKDDIEVRR
jgi:imidazole glycerol-phosphate synthase subunit HisF